MYSLMGSTLRQVEMTTMPFTYNVSRAF